MTSEYSGIKRLENGTVEYYKNGVLHRENGPAVIHANGTKIWYKNGLLHRENGPAFESFTGHKQWRINGQPHRKGGPAIEWDNGDKYWFKNGRYHREDGPALDCANGLKVWYLEGVKYSEREHAEKIKEAKKVGKAMTYKNHLILNMKVAVRCLVLTAFHALHGIIPSKYTSHEYWGI